MGLINNILVSFIHLLFVVFDILFVMILTRFIYLRWRLSWLKQIANAIEPWTSSVLRYFQKLISRVTDKTYPEKIQLALLVIFVSVIRLIIASLL